MSSEGNKSALLPATPLRRALYRFVGLVTCLYRAGSVIRLPLEAVSNKSLANDRPADLNSYGDYIETGVHEISKKIMIGRADSHRLADGSMIHAELRLHKGIFNSQPECHRGGTPNLLKS